MPRRRKKISSTEIAIGRKLREIRESKGMSQGKLARALGVNQSRISEYEQGEIRVHGAAIVAIARTLGASADEILGLKKAKRQRPRNSRLLGRLKRIEDLPADERRAVLKILDSLLERHSGNGQN